MCSMQIVTPLQMRAIDLTPKSTTKSMHGSVSENIFERRVHLWDSRLFSLPDSRGDSSHPLTSEGYFAVDKKLC